MRQFIIFIICCLIFFGCKSVPDDVKENKDKFIQVAKELTSTPVDINNIKDLYTAAKEQNIEGKMKYLGVDNIETQYASVNKPIKLDSIIVFNKSNYKILYDFTVSGRDENVVRQASSLTEFEKIDDRLYMGKN